MKLFGDILLEEGSNVSFDYIRRIIKRPVIKPRYRLSVLNPDESIDYLIPESDIIQDSLNYTESYQNGQRRNVSVTLYNGDGIYTPNIDKIWLTTKFRLDIGLGTTKDNIIWFPRGVYVLGDVALTNANSGRTIQLQLKDKYAIFEGKMGTLESPYEIERDSTIEDALNGLMNFAQGNGYILDYKPIILDPSLVGFKTQNTIREEEGGNLGSIIDALATQMSAEYYYNNLGNLCFYPINETVDDSVKPVIWTFEKLNRELGDMNLSYKNEEVVNVVKVVGDNIDNGVYSAIVTNENPESPICIQRIGRRAAPKYTSSNIWSNDLAEDLARYYLRKNSFIGVDFSTTVTFNPLLTVNNICEVENDFLNLEREKLLITSISFTGRDGNMVLKLCNTSDLPFVIDRKRVK